MKNIILVIIVVIVISVVISSVLIINQPFLNNKISLPNTITGDIFPTYRIGSTNTTLAMVYMDIIMSNPSYLILQDINILINNSPMVHYNGNYYIHYPKGNGISGIFETANFWTSTVTNNTTGYVVLFPNLITIGKIQTGDQVDIIFSKIIFIGNAVILKPSYFSPMSWEGIDISITYSGYAGGLVGAIGDTNYIILNNSNFKNNIHLSSTWNTVFSNNTATLNFSLKSYDPGYVPTPFEIYIVNLNDYDILAGINVTSLTNRSGFIYQGNLTSIFINFNSQNMTVFGKGDSFILTMKFSTPLNAYYAGNNLGIEILYKNKQINLLTLVPP